MNGLKCLEVGFHAGMILQPNNSGCHSSRGKGVVLWLYDKKKEKDDLQSHNVSTCDKTFHVLIIFTFNAMPTIGMPD